MARMTRKRFRPSRAIAYLRDEEKKAAEKRAKAMAADLSESGEKAMALVRQAVADALENGESLEEFRKRFDAIAAKTGWDPRGGRNFRARIIYQTNLRVARQAGRWSQMQEMKAEAPFWQYRHGGSAKPRKEHLEWDGLILHADHPWWQTHYPPNGFGCSCRVVPLDAEGVKRQWKKAGGEGEPPELTPESGGIVFDRGTRGQRENPRLWTPPDPEQDGIPVEMNGKLVRVPRGIDPGWDYVPQLSPEAEEAARKEREAAAAEAETPTAEQAHQPEPRKAPETPAPEPQKPEPEPTPAEPAEEPKDEAKDDTETKRRALLDALAADLVHALEELRDIARDKERDLRAQKLAPEALDAALKELRESLEEAENEAKQAHEKAVQRAFKVEFAEDDDPDGVRAFLVRYLAKAVEWFRKVSFDTALATMGRAAEAKKAVEKITAGEEDFYKETAKLYPEFKALNLADEKDARTFNAMKWPVKEAYRKAIKGDESVWTRKQAEAVKAYTTGEYKKFNAAKRNAFYGDALEKNHNHYAQQAAEATAALEKMRLQENCILTRGVGGLDFLRSHVAMNDIRALNSLLKNGDIVSVVDKINAAIKNKSFSRVFVEPAFMSASGAMTGGFEKKPVVLRILAHKGTPGVCAVGGISAFKGQNEVLIAPPPKLTILNVYHTKNEKGEDKLVIIAELAEDRIGGEEMRHSLPSESQERIR